MVRGEGAQRCLFSQLVREVLVAARWLCQRRGTARLGTPLLVFFSFVSKGAEYAVSSGLSNSEGSREEQCGGSNIGNVEAFPEGKDLQKLYSTEVIMRKVQALIFPSPGPWYLWPKDQILTLLYGISGVL